MFLLQTTAIEHHGECTVADVAQKHSDLAATHPLAAALRPIQACKNHGNGKQHWMEVLLPTLQESSNANALEEPNVLQSDSLRYSPVICEAICCVSWVHSTVCKTGHLDKSDKFT